MDKILTISKASNVLQIDPDTVIGLLQSSELTGFKIKNQWRIRESDLSIFFEKQIEAQRLRNFSDALVNPKKWSEALLEFPDLLRKIQAGEFQDGTVGEFLKKALEENGDIS